MKSREPRLAATGVHWCCGSDETLRWATAASIVFAVTRRECLPRAKTHVRRVEGLCLIDFEILVPAGVKQQVWEAEESEEGSR